MFVPARLVHSESAKQVPDSWSEFEHAVFWYLTMLVRPRSDGALWAETDPRTKSTEMAPKTSWFILHWRFGGT